MAYTYHMTTLKLNITKAVVILQSGTDIVSLYTTLPSPYPVEITDQMKLSFDAPGGSGVEYVRENFGIEAEVIDTTCGTIKFGDEK